MAVTGRAAGRVILEAVAGRAGVLGAAVALAAYALPVIRSRAQQALIAVAREILAFTERTRDHLAYK